MMFGSKSFDGVGFPTPSSIPTETAYRLAKVPSDASWLAVFMGMLEVGLSEENWQQFEGGITREAAVEVWMQIISDMYAFAENPNMLTDVRQNPDTPCILEKTSDGVTWVPFADLQMCPPLLTIGQNGTINVGYHTAEGFGSYQVDPGPWVDDPLVDIVGAAQPWGPMTTQNNDQCTAAGNVAYVLRRLFEDVQTGFAASATQTGGGLAEILTGAVETLFGPAIAGVVATALASAMLGYQAIFALTSFTDADFRKIACLVNNHMSGSAGNWSFDYGAIYSGLASAGLSTYLDQCLQDLLDKLGPNALTLASKTTALASYDCTSHTAVWYAGSTTYNWWGGTNDVFTVQFPDLNPGTIGLFRIRNMGPALTGAVILGSDNTQATPRGWTQANTNDAIILTASINDSWGLNTSVYANNAAALAGIRSIPGYSAYTPQRQLTAGGNAGLAAGVKPCFRFKLYNGVGGYYLTLLIDLWAVTSFAAC